jgi:hypothetical protein
MELERLEYRSWRELGELRVSSVEARWVVFLCYMIEGPELRVC